MTAKRFTAKAGLDNNGQTITNVADPVNAQDVTTKAYFVWPNVGSKPTTISGYGITDAVSTVSPTFTGVPTAPVASTGTRSTQLATMQSFANEFALSLSQNGWQKLPSGLIIQWGVVTAGSLSVQGGLTYSLPIAFPNGPLVGVAVHVGGGAANSTITAITLTASTVYISTDYGINIPASWIALGH